MRNSTPVEVELNGPPPHADRPAGEQVAGRARRSLAQTASDGQEGELRAVRQVPERHAPARAHGQHPAVTTDRRVSIIN